MIIIPNKNGVITSTNVSDNSNLDHDIIKVYLWEQLSEAVDALKATATHELSATGLSLSERVGIGDTTPPRPGDEQGHEQRTLSGTLTPYVDKKGKLP